MLSKTNYLGDLEQGLLLDRELFTIDPPIIFQELYPGSSTINLFRSNITKHHRKYNDDYVERNINYVKWERIQEDTIYTYYVFIRMIKKGSEQRIKPYHDAIEPLTDLCYSQISSCHILLLLKLKNPIDWDDEKSISSAISLMNWNQWKTNILQEEYNEYLNKALKAKYKYEGFEALNEIDSNTKEKLEQIETDRRYLKLFNPNGKKNKKGRVERKVDE